MCMRGMIRSIWSIPTGRDCVWDAVLSISTDTVGVVGIVSSWIGSLGAATAEAGAATADTGVTLADGSIGYLGFESLALPGVGEIVGGAAIGLGIFAMAYFAAEVIAECSGQHFPL